MHDHGVPKGNPGQAVQLDRGNHVLFRKAHDAPSGQKLNFALRELWIDVQLPRGNREVLLHYLERNHERAATLIVRNQPDCTGFLFGLRSIVGVHEDIGVKKSQPAHRRSCNSSRSNFQSPELPLAWYESLSNSAASSCGSLFPDNSSK